MKSLNLIRHSLTTLVLGLVLTPLWSAQAMAETGPHELAYAEALQRLESAPGRLLREIDSIRRGDVAHFDFLQHEHIELLRDARALRFPPASLESDRRAALREQAERVLRLATALELTLADFLRSQALVNAALSSTVDIADLASRRADSDSRSTLAGLSKAAVSFRRTANEETRSALMRAFDDIAGISISAQYRDELSAQRQLVQDNAERIERALDKIPTAELNTVTAQLVELFGQKDSLLSSR